MLGYQIAEQISKFGPVYDSLSGIVSIDQIPKTIGLYKYIVSNLSTSELPGTHWIVSRIHTFKTNSNLIKSTIRLSLIKA